MNKTCPCGRTFTPDHGNQKYCPACQTLRYNARHPLKPCRKCGKQTRELRRSSSWCAACRAESDQRRREEVKAQRKANDLATRKVKRDGSEAEKRYLENFPSQSREEKWQDFGYALGFLLSLLVERPDEETPAEPEEVHPEQVPHDDQDDIDAQFRDIMGRVNWL